MAKRYRYKNLKWGRISILAVLLVLLQSLIPLAGTAGAAPNLTLALLLVVSPRLSHRRCPLFGWILGLVQDMFSGTPFGTYALVYMGAAPLCSSIAEMTFIEHPLTQATTGFVFSAAVDAAAAAATTLLRGTSFLEGDIVLLDGIYTGIAVVVLNHLVWKGLSPGGKREYGLSPRW